MWHKTPNKQTNLKVFKSRDSVVKGKLVNFRNKAINSLFITFNLLPDDKTLGLPKLKAFADDKSNVTQNVKVVPYFIE